MSDTLPAIRPSLARAFEPERQALQTRLSSDLSTAQIVSETRRALDRTGDAFARSVSDPHLHKAGLWLLEMIKSGAGILDRGTDADIIWGEVAPQPKRKWAGRGLFYGAASLFALAGFVQGSGLVILSAGVLAALRFFDPKDWGHVLSKLPFSKRPAALEDHSGRRLSAQARVSTDTLGYIDSLTDAVKTADHLLARLAEPQTASHWRDDPRLMGVLHSLLEASSAQDGAFALRVVDRELTSVLAGVGIELMSYSSQNADMFDIMPAVGQDGTREAAPAVVFEGRLLRRGIVWASDA